MSIPRRDADQKLPGGHITVTNTNLIETHASDLSTSDVDEKHKVPPSKEIAVSSGDEDSIDLTSEEFADIPELVRNIVSFEDDATLPVITFRSVLLSIVFCVLGSFVSQLAYFRTTTAAFPVFFVILVSQPLGRLLARILPDYTVPLGRFSFSLNPGPFSIKEHAIIGIAANSGSQGQWATYLPTNAALYYGITINPALALFFGWGASLLGFAYAAMVRRILIDDPEFIFPPSLQQVALYRSMEGTSGVHAALAKKKMNIFYMIMTITFAWQFLPEFLFPMVAALAPLCWFAPNNHTVNFLGAGAKGIGLLNITLDWSNITSKVITYPYSVQVVIFVGFVITTWILIPVAYFGDIWGSPTYDIMSNTLFTKNGSDYPFTSLIYTDASGNQQVNETKYEEIGLCYAGAQYTWEIFLWYASYISSYVWAGLFLAPKIKKLWQNRANLATYRTDRLNRIMQKYPGITKWEWVALGVVPFVILLVIVATNSVWMSTWTYFVALGFGASAMLPMSLVYAISGYAMQVGIFNELVYGYMIEAPGSNRHPLGQLAYRIISGNTWYDSQSVLQDQKIGHYLHIPPRDVIGIQLLAFVVALPVNYGVMRWVLATKYDYVTGAKTDPSGQWTGQDFQSYNTEGIMYALVGPKRLFASSYFSPVLFGFLIGALAPAIIWLLHRRFPKLKFNLWNTTIFFASAATFRGNLSTGPFTAFIVGTVFNFYLYRYRHTWWNKWAYISGAALDTGYNMNLLFIFVFLGSTGVVMANWWGNNADNAERCFAL
ncbi:hypothetical protein N0V93_006807 [Gnomoniopsis smithogilvyi]|uniref:Oligopeptide transporter n=1 Tax=Gnomoniopsis smithogilvyi TaxID=1191159 RepID=A0A9W8YSL0_9PEZI|nr:hypothetical protein N0V93_006807 [Gnomoniopsis smithogilvyi]